MRAYETGLRARAFGEVRQSLAKLGTRDPLPIPHPGDRQQVRHEHRPQSDRPEHPERQTPDNTDKEHIEDDDGEQRHEPERGKSLELSREPYDRDADNEER